MTELSRATDAQIFNAIVNDPSVYPFVRGMNEGELDLTPVVANPNNVVLTGSRGAVLFAIRQIGLYEMNVTVLPEGRGDWAIRAAREALEWAFIHTSAVEIVMRAPYCDPAANPFARLLGFGFEFTSPRGWIYEGQPVAADIFSLKIQDWLRSARWLDDAAKGWHSSLAREFSRAGRPPYVRVNDEIRDRYLGALLMMIAGEQPQKGVIFYDRFAQMMGYPTIALVGFNPTVINVDGTEFEVHGRSLFMVSPSSGAVN